MEMSLALAKTIASLFLVMFAGFLLVKIKIVKSDDSKVLSKTLLYIIAPCTIINAFQIDCTSETLTGFLIALVAAVVINVLNIAAARLLRRPLHLTPVEEASIAYPNAGNLVIPLILATMGGEWVIYASPYMIVQLILMWTHCVMLISGQRKVNIRKMLLNSSILSIAAGLVLFFTGFRFPAVIQNAVDMTGSMVGPVNMLVIGMLLGGMDSKAFLRDARLYAVSALRLLVFPAVAAVILAFSGAARLLPIGMQVLTVSMMAAASASAATVTQFAQLYDTDTGYAGRINIVTTLGSIITMPLLVGLFRWFASM